MTTSLKWLFGKEISFLMKNVKNVFGHLKRQLNMYSSETLVVAFVLFCGRIREELINTKKSYLDITSSVTYI